jgi:hypothetical protein
MNKTVLLAAAAAFALTAGGASAAQHPAIAVSGAKVTPVFHKAKGAKVLYNQTSSENGEAIDSQNFTSGTYSAYNDSGADDFVVPKKAQWTITEVDAPGAYFDSSGICSGSCEFATSENVIFYANGKKGVPGKALKGGTFTNLSGTDNDGSFSISLGKKGIKLKSGTYWVAVVANDDFSSTGYEWGWDENAKIHGNPAVWENPGGGFGLCPSWGTINKCITSAPAGDFAFELLGKSKK